MKKILFLGLIALISIGCNSSAPTQTQSNSAPSTTKKTDELTVRSHTTENQTPPTNKPNSGGAPNQTAVDVSALTANIEKSEKEFKVKTTDAKAKEILANAYFERAFVLTKAAQYSSALGDFRKGLKLNPEDKEAKAMHDQIVSIYQSIKKEVPKEGEEMSPIPMEKSK